MDTEDCIKLANLSKDLLVSRRRIEWRFNFAFWGAIVANAVFLYEAGYSKTNLGAWYWIILVGAFVATVVFMFLYLPMINGSNLKDLRLIQYYREKADDKLSKHLSDGIEQQTLEPKRHLENIHLSSREYFNTAKNERVSKSNYWRLTPYLIVSVLIYCALAVLLTLPRSPSSQVGMNYRFNEGPLNGATGSLAVKGTKLFYNKLNVPHITTDGKVVTGELMLSLLPHDSSNLPFYHLNAKTNEYDWWTTE